MKNAIAPFIQNSSFLQGLAEGKIENMTDAEIARAKAAIIKLGKELEA